MINDKELLQLEKRFYSRSELSQLTGAREEDTRHFKRNVESVLSNWGYGIDWSKNGAIIKHIPTLPEEKLRELLIRKFHVDIQVDMYAFACFVTAYSDVPGFECMPQAIRETEYYRYSGKN